MILHPNRSVDIGNIKHYREFFDSQRVRRIYLDELGETASLPIGIATVKLVVVAEDIAIREARELIDRTKSEINSPLKQQQLLQFIETIVAYKFPTMSREDMEKIFGLSELKQTKFYQEAFQEGIQQGKLQAVRPMLAAGLTVEYIGQALDLSVEEVRQVTQSQS